MVSQKKPQYNRFQKWRSTRTWSISLFRLVNLFPTFVYRYIFFYPQLGSNVYEGLPVGAWSHAHFWAMPLPWGRAFPPPHLAPPLCGRGFLPNTVLQAPVTPGDTCPSPGGDSSRPNYSFSPLVGWVGVAFRFLAICASFSSAAVTR